MRPDGGTPEKPVGLVFTGLAGPGGTSVARHLFPGTREHIRERAAMAVYNQRQWAEGEAAPEIIRSVPLGSGAGNSWRP